MPTLNAKQHRRGEGVHASAAEALLAWYDANRRELPWRAKAGEGSDPYRVWLSEIMLQQTTVAAVAPYYSAFLARWPDVKRLAAASQDDVLGAWAGLGYYSRARNLHSAAKMVVQEYGGSFPTSAAQLRKLPGIGAYTAAAVAAIAFGERAAAMDANAESVIARLFAVEEPLPKARAKLAMLAAPLVPEQRPGDFAQALMDLGSVVCVPKRPHCSACPLAPECRGRALGIVQDLPRKAAQRARPLKRGAAFVALDRQGAVYLVRRPQNGLLGAMLQPPLGEWSETFPKKAKAIEEAPFMGNWIKKPGFVRHGFTHFILEMEVYVALFRRRPNGEGTWYTSNECENAALPTVMRKVISHARDLGGPLFELTVSFRSSAPTAAREPRPSAKRPSGSRSERGRARPG
jgi:A/G-specific adenine glycosylase